MNKRLIALPITALSVLLAAAAIIVSLGGKITSEEVSDGVVEALAGEWSVSRSAALGEEVTVYSCAVPPSCELADGYLYIQSYWTECAVSAGGEVLYSNFNNDADGYVHLFKLGAIKAGESITVEFRTKQQSDLSLLYGSSFYIGDGSGIYNRVLFDNIYAFVFWLLASALGAFVICTALLFRKPLRETNRYFGILSLGLFAATAGVWVLTDSQLLLLVTNRTATVALVSMLSFFAMPIFLLGFTSCIIKISGKIYEILIGLYAVILNAYALNYALGLFSGLVFVTSEHILSLVTLAVIFYYGVSELRRVGGAKLKIVLLGYAVFGVGSLAALYMFYARPFSGYSQAYALGTAGFIVLLFDVACRELYEQLEQSVNLKLQARLAYIDAMTGVGNRAAFREQQLADKNGKGAVAYLLADVNNLKTTNDTLGHAVGDKLIIRTARALAAAAGEKGACYRIGGDEFVVRLHDISEAEAAETARRFYSLVEKDNAQQQPRLSAAVGCAWTDAEQKDADLLLGRADAEMYKEKQRLKAQARGAQ